MNTHVKRIGLLAGLLSAIIPASAYDFEADGIYYDILSADDLTLSVTFAAKTEAEQQLYATGDIVIPSELTFDDTTYSVRAIGDYAFRYCSGLTSVTLPSTISSIGTFAFLSCSGLTTFHIPASAETLGSYALGGCSSLTEITVAEENPVFTSRDGVLYSKDEKTLAVCGGGLTGEFTVPEGVVTIGENAFYLCDGLTTVHLPASVTVIGKEAFMRCSNLVSANLPEGLLSIGANAFFGCSALASAEIPANVTSIGTCAFYNCESLTSMSIPASVTEIGNTAFYGCSGIAAIDVAEENTAFRSLEGILYNKDMTELITVPCRKEGEVVIPETVATIASYAFANCLHVTSVTIPESVATIGTFAFANDTAIETISCLATTPPQCTTIFLVSTVFADETFKKAILYVPAGCKGAYQSANPWRSFANIEELEGVSDDEEEEEEEPGEESAVHTIGAESGFSVSIAADRIILHGYEGNTSLYSSEGELIYCGNASEISRPAHGLYILRVGKNAVKILL